MFIATTCSEAPWLFSFFLIGTPRLRHLLDCLTSSRSFWIFRITCFSEVICCCSIYLSEFTCSFISFFNSTFKITSEFSVRSAHILDNWFNHFWLCFKSLINIFSSAHQFSAPFSVLSLRINKNQQIFPILQHNNLTNTLVIQNSICVNTYNFLHSKY